MRRSTPFLAALAPVIAALATACTQASDSPNFGSGMRGESLDAWSGQQFDRIAMLGSDNLIFTTGEGYGLRAEGDPELVRELRFVVVDGELKIGRNTRVEWMAPGGEPVKIYATAPSLTALKLSGSGDAEVDALAGPEGRVSIAGSGTASIRSVRAEDLKARIAGSGDIRLGGQATRASFDVAGSGDIDGRAFTATDVRAKIAGSGDVTFRSEGTVDARIMGSGDVTVLGNAKCTSKVMGSGTFRCG